MDEIHIDLSNYVDNPDEIMHLFSGISKGELVRSSYNLDNDESTSGSVVTVIIPKNSCMTYSYFRGLIGNGISNCRTIQRFRKRYQFNTQPDDRINELISSWITRMFFEYYAYGRVL